jgi:hypothetical protein
VGQNIQENLNDIFILKFFPDPGPTDLKQNSHIVHSSSASRTAVKKLDLHVHILEVLEVLELCSVCVPLQRGSGSK